MTILLDIATLALLLLVLTFVPILGLRHEVRITRQIREAQQARESTGLGGPADPAAGRMPPSSGTPEGAARPGRQACGTAALI